MAFDWEYKRPTSREELRRVKGKAAPTPK